MARKHKPRRVVSVSVPDDLRRRMARFKDSVNWSAVACRAFESAIAEIISQKEARTMDDVVMRLKASKRSAQSELYRDGYEHGSAWASNHAAAIELEHLGRLYDRLQSQPPHDWHGLFADDNRTQSGATVAESLYISIRPESDQSRSAVGCFWEAILGDSHDKRLTQGQWVKGFAEGALSVWDRVKARL